MITCKCNPKFLYVSKETFDKHVNGQAHIDMMMQKLKKDISKIACKKADGSLVRRTL